MIEPTLNNTHQNPPGPLHYSTYSTNVPLIPSKRIKRPQSYPCVCHVCRLAIFLFPQHIQSSSRSHNTSSYVVGLSMIELTLNNTHTPLPSGPPDPPPPLPRDSCLSSSICNTPSSSPLLGGSTISTSASSHCPSATALSGAGYVKDHFPVRPERRCASIKNFVHMLVAV